MQNNSWRSTQDVHTTAHSQHKAPNLVYCRQCGRAITDTAKFCRQCGVSTERTRLTEEAENAETSSLISDWLTGGVFQALMIITLVCFLTVGVNFFFSRIDHSLLPSAFGPVASSEALKIADVRWSPDGAGYARFTLTVENHTAMRQAVNLFDVVFYDSSAMLLNRHSTPSSNSADLELLGASIAPESASEVSFRVKLPALTGYATWASVCLCDNAYTAGMQKQESVKGKR